MTRKPVKVLDRNGRFLGEVSSNATSVGASKIAGGPVEYGRMLLALSGENKTLDDYAWIKKARA